MMYWTDIIFKILTLEKFGICKARNIKDSIPAQVNAIKEKAKVYKKD